MIENNEMPVKYGYEYFVYCRRRGFAVEEKIVNVRKEKKNAWHMIMKPQIEK